MPDTSLELATAIQQRDALLRELETAITCVKWCRANHKNRQSGTGIPVEVIWQDLIDQIKASTARFDSDGNLMLVCKSCGAECPVVHDYDCPEAQE